MKISIGILSYNTCNLLEKCLNSIYKHTKHTSFEVIVVDNASYDGSSEMIEKKFPGVKLIKNKKNLFFARAYNQAIKVANGKYFLMMNSDTYLNDNSVKKLIDYMEKNKIDACEGLQLNEKNIPIRTSSKFTTPLLDFYELSMIGKFFKNVKKINEYRMIDYDRKKTFEVDVACNAFMAVDKKTLNKVGNYDENFILYYTEYDLCKRIKTTGGKVMHYSGAHVFHKESSSAKKLDPIKRLQIYYKDMYTYHRKYNNKIFSIFLYSLLIFELNLIIKPSIYSKN